jgi:hypothetical protein
MRYLRHTNDSSQEEDDMRLVEEFTRSWYEQSIEELMSSTMQNLTSAPIVATVEAAFSPAPATLARIYTDPKYSGMVQQGREMAASLADNWSTNNINPANLNWGLTHPNLGQPSAVDNIESEPTPPVASTSMGWRMDANSIFWDGNNYTGVSDSSGTLSEALIASRRHAGENETRHQELDRRCRDATRTLEQARTLKWEHYQEFMRAHGLEKFIIPRLVKPPPSPELKPSRPPRRRGQAADPVGLDQVTEEEEILFL